MGNAFSVPFILSWTRLIEEDQIAHAFGRLFLFFTAHAFRRLSFFHFACVFAHVRLDVSFFHCASVQTSPFFRWACPQTSLFSFPLRMRSGSLFSFPLLIRLDISFFPLRMHSDASLFISAAHAFRPLNFFSAAHPFSRLVVMKRREKRPGVLLQEVMRDSLPQSLA